MFFNDEQEEPASTIVRLSSGDGYDIKNLPGAKRKQLIESGQASINDFVRPDNTPGSKLAEIRQEASGDIGIEEKIINKSKPPVDINTLEEGSLVNYRNNVVEVKKVSKNKEKILINADGNKQIWIKISKVSAVEIPPDNEE